VRALIDYRPALRERSGIGEYTHELVRALACGFSADALDLAVFSSSWKDRLEMTDPDLERVQRIDRRWPVRALNFAWHRLETPAIETLAGESFDVVHSMTPLLVPSQTAAQVITIADLSFLTEPAWTRAEIRRDYPALVRSHAGRADAVLVMSEHVGGEVRRRAALVARADRLLGVQLGQPARLALELGEVLRADVLLEQTARDRDRDQPRNHDAGQEERRQPESQRAEHGSS